MSDCNCEDIIIEVSEEGIDGNGIVSISLQSTSGLEKTYRMTFTNGTYFDYIVTDGSSIASIAKTATNVLTDTYTITLTSGETTSFQVTNGRGITKIEKSGSSGSLTDVYTITYNDGTTMTYNVKNGRGITSIYKTGSSGLQDTYTILFNDGTTTEYTVMNGAKGDTGNGIASITKTSSSGLNDVYTILFTNGTTTTFTVKNGRGVTTVTKTGSSGLIDTYRMSFNDSTYVDFTVTNGEKGDSATIAIGTVTTGAEGSSASVTNRGDEHDAIWDITIPRGNTGNGISSITLLSQLGLVKTYRITYTNGNHFDFSVSDGNGIASIEKTATQGNVDTYTVTFTDPTAEPFTYDVTNGSDTWGAIVGDLSDQTDLQQALDTKAPVIIASAQGDIVTIADGADNLPVESLSVSVEAVQDLHGYDNPWPAGAYNKLPTFDPNNPPTVTGLTITVSQDGKLTLSGTVTETTTINAPVGTWEWDGVSDYWLSGCPSGGNFLNSYSLRVSTDSNSIYSEIDTGNGHKLDTYVIQTGSIANRHLHYTIILRSGTYSNLTFAPMLEAGLAKTTYTPYSNVCPISGHTQAIVTRTGINIWGGEKMADDMVSIVNNATYCEKGTDSIGKYVTLQASSAIDKVLLSGCFKENTQYTFVFKYKKSNTNANLNIGLTYTDGTYQSLSKTSTPTADTVYTDSFTTLANKTIKAIRGVWGSGKTYFYYEESGLIEGAVSASDFVPYQGTTVTIALSQTVYGATVYPLEGKMVVDRGLFTFDGSEDELWADYSAYNGFNIDASLTEMKSGYHHASICNWMKPNEPVYTGKPTYWLGVNNNRFYVINTVQLAGAQDVSKWRAYLAEHPLQLTYPLATPIVITGLTPAIMSTLLGTNNIWADCGAVSVDYRADTKLFIERLTQPTEDDMVANANIASGKFFMIGNSLYFSTASIAAGEAIVPGTNCTALSLADALNNLNA